MTNSALTIQDLPLGTVFPDAPYNRLLLEAIASQKAGETVTESSLDALEKTRLALWEQSNALKNQNLRDYGLHTARCYGFAARDGKLDYPWMETEHRRVGYGSNYYTCDLGKKTLVPSSISNDKPRVIVFATGRAFAEKNARLGDITAEDAVEKARNIMSAQVYLVGSRLVPGYQEGDVDVVAVAYDMVTSEEETPALRIQNLLNPDYRHPVSILAAERIFGPMIAEAEAYPTGGLVRRDGRIVGKPLPDEQILANLSGLALVGGSVGCIVSIQAARWLDHLLKELGVSEAVREEAARTFLVINLGPTTPISAGDTNLLSVINLRDEFVFSGNHIEPHEIRAANSGRCIIADEECAETDSATGWTVVLDAPGTLTPTAEGLQFDPLRTHFGHSLKHYANGLRDIGLSSVVGRALAHQGAFRLGELIADAEESGKLKTAWQTSS